jgi:hypothetical protein
MKKAAVSLLSLSLCVILLTGCASEPSQLSTDAMSDQQNTIPFSDDQLYAVAYLGYLQPTDLDYYAERYLNSSQLPVHYLSSGDYYLVIPRYEGMALSLYQNSIDTSIPTLRFSDPDCEPFLIQCNVSDIFADATIHLAYGDREVEFSPFLSLKDGSVQIGDFGLLLEKTDPA